MAWQYVCMLLVLFINTLGRVNGSCNLSLKNDFGNPVYLHNGGFLAPKTSGAILLRRSETLQVACPGDKKNAMLGNTTTPFDIIDLKCVSNTTFRAVKFSWVGELREVKCAAPPWFTTEKTNVVCSPGYHIYRVGYKIRDEFFKLYEACFNGGLMTTSYVKHELSPTSFYHQTGSRRPQFIEGDVFLKVRMSELYKLERQKSRVNELLGPDAAAKYISKKQFLNRGHLAANVDFPMQALQRATFHYINTAPQWNRGNAGDWAALEEALRRRMKTYNSSVTVYTGTHGVSTLADSSDRHQELFLHTDANNNGVVPVPLYFYKLVYDPRKKLAAAFISINSLYYDSHKIEELSFCEDICGRNPQYSWLKWRANDATHSFCCEYHEFVQKIDGLPKLNVKGLFY